MKKFFLLLGLLLSFKIIAQPLSQAEIYTQADTLRGTLSPIRTWFDVTYYNLFLTINPKLKTIAGYNDIYFLTINKQNTMQIDLFDELNIDSIVYNHKTLPYTRKFNAVFIDVATSNFELNKVSFIRIYYSGKPKEAINPPWDGGLVWRKDKNNDDWISVACQEIGASVWYPNKDHQSDEPDSMTISIACNKNLMCVSNGNLKSTTPENENIRYTWFVSYPINNYGVSFTIGNMAHFSDTYKSEDGSNLALDYYVLAYNLEAAKKQFEQVKPMLKCYEHYFGKYPFWNDGYALIETPFLGMEHQSGIAYGNQYKNGYTGIDYSLIGIKFDYIIIHETGHEWWGNNLTSADIADMWIHEGFCTYGESLYIECLYGYDKAIQYINAKRFNIENDKPIIGTYNLNKKGSDDMYIKGSFFLNTLRTLVHNDTQWFEFIKELQSNYKLSIVTTNTILTFLEHKTKQKFDKVFEQYLNYTNPPKIKYELVQKGKNLLVKYKWDCDVANFNMSYAYINKNNISTPIYPTQNWQQIIIKKMKINDFKWDKNHYYVAEEKINK